jgi:hypothetical protein
VSLAAVDSAGWIAWGCWKVLWGAHPPPKRLQASSP